MRSALEHLYRRGMNALVAGDDDATATSKHVGQRVLTRLRRYAAIVKNSIATTDWEETMATTYATVQGLLDKVIGGGGATIGAHGAFWRTLTRDKFIDHSEFGETMIKRNADGSFDPDESALIKALEARKPFGKDVGTPGAIFRRMPAGRAPMSPGDIKIIRDWIKAKCPA